MKQLSLLVALTVCTIQLSFAQVKKQYQDKVFNQTTVVVKKDQVSDVDILNSMDLDDIGMDQIIQIKTAPEQPAPVQQTTIQTNNSLPEAAPAEIEETVAAIPQTPVVQQQRAATPRASANESTASTSTTSAKRGGSGNYRVIKHYPKMKNRRFKKTKRKKFKGGKRMSCFKF